MKRDIRVRVWALFGTNSKRVFKTITVQAKNGKEAVEIMEREYSFPFLYELQVLRKNQK